MRVGSWATLVMGVVCSIVLAGCAGSGGGTGSGFAGPPTLSPSPSPAAISSSDAAGLQLWVSPKGSDANPGTSAKPFLTLQRARDAVRALDRTSRLLGVSVNMRDGVYRQSQPFVLEARDSGLPGHDVVYRSAPGEHAVISGAVQVSGWTISDPQKNIYSAFVGNVKSRQAYVNGQRAIRARTTWYPSGFLPSFVYVGGTAVQLGIEYIPTDLNPAAWRDPSKWTNPQDVEAVILTQWKMMRVPVASVVPYPKHPINFLLQPLLLLLPNPPLQGTGLLQMQEPAWSNANEFLLQYTKQPGPWSFWQATWFENAYEFLDEPGEFYINSQTGYIYYIPRAGEDMSTADVELPVLETLVDGHGTIDQPLTNVRFEGLEFTGATWLQPSTQQGYVADQSAFLVTGNGHPPNVWGHDEHTVRTPGNLTFQFARQIRFVGNIFDHLGAVGLDFPIGSQGNVVQENLFTDISSSALMLGGVSTTDARPPVAAQATTDNLISGNLIRNVGVEYQDAAGLFVGFAARTRIENNTFVDTPWSAIAMGWGWGLLDSGMFPGNPGSVRGEWGTFTTPTQNSGNRVTSNRFYRFGNMLRDVGAIYTQGQQGTSASDPLVIEGNVATDKRGSAGSNIFYTDGGSRYIVVRNNVSADNGQGVFWFGPGPKPTDPLPYPNYGGIPIDLKGHVVNCQPYGLSIGGCVTYGDIVYEGNYWGSDQFYAPCADDKVDGLTWPINIQMSGNHIITTLPQAPSSLVDAAGVQSRPDTIPEERWVLPPDGATAPQMPVDCP